LNLHLGSDKKELFLNEINTKTATPNPVFGRGPNFYANTSEKII
jgi:hypothetical protein